MRMDPEEIRKVIKRISIIGSFFVAAFLFYLLGRGGRAPWPGVLLLYALLVTVVMVLAILVQSGRGGGLAGLGGAGGDSFLGARAATPIAKATYVMGALLLFICMLLARIGTEAGVSRARLLRDDAAPAVPDDQPGFPGEPDGEGDGGAP